MWLILIDLNWQTLNYKMDSKLEDSDSEETSETAITTTRQKRYGITAFPVLISTLCLLIAVAVCKCNHRYTTSGTCTNNLGHS